ncbi:metallophosphoesterase [Helcococcus ovis]|uniref:Serine/threonine protein phosphatase n=1 Tax=Helcococcus ovis TaxID=72026 RepID=A0A4R9C2H5_9FIRM|nr:metallophosphoesterase [Helcococcus ovis]TFF64398.1 serine/threonine protein phosphatase [Helcococcus ovis]TFF66803.1 serine/threonine protein phosphatase [Helcococcus ovis]TFF67181.1 serine/threonine protein phosphatase [Helcococcus ovis]WNZ02061.1 metallophosphoesterase [Helcococcus ovis]
MIYAIADLHLDVTKKKDMSVFGGNWGGYEEKIFNQWNDIITNDDLVLIPGDISWAMRLEDAVKDLDRIEKLNGTKILMKGNHDYWWSSLKKINNLNYKTMSFLQNNSFIFNKKIIVGTRGWDSRDSASFDENDEKIFSRELARLELSINDALERFKEYDEIIAMLHYPPFDKKLNPNEFTEIFKKYNIKKVIYGHIHGNLAKKMPHGLIDGIEYFCVSGDLIDFKPIKITN